MKIEQIRTIIKEKSSEQARSNGTPFSGEHIDRQLSEAGRERKPEDIPTQDTMKRNGKTNPGSFSGTFKPSTDETGKSYVLGQAKRPPITFDKGFSVLPKQDPTMDDYWDLFKWRSMSEGAALVRPDLADAIAAYNHFHDGEGKEKEFSYERYVMHDNSGILTLQNAILEAQDAAIKLYLQHGKKQFYFTGPEIRCGSSKVGYANMRRMYPYPATENWQKAIGAHSIWLSGFVTVKTRTTIKAKPEFKMNLTLQAEDQYNFNPSMKDIATGLPDDSNGRFVVVGFAQGYRHVSTLRRTFSWKGFDLGIASMGIRILRRTSKPSVERESTL